LALTPVFRLDNECPTPVLPYETVSVRSLLRNGKLRAFAVANAAWEFSFSGLKSFIVLYIVKGIGHSPSTASLVIAVVAVASVAGAAVAAGLADRHGTRRVLQVAALVYGTGLVLGVLPPSLAPLLVGLPVVAFAGAILMTLPQALAFRLAPAGSEGAAAG